MPTMMARAYSPIRDLEDSELSDMTRGVPTALMRVWRRRRDGLLTPSVLEKLGIRWGAELGLVEDVFRWDRGVTETLVESGISAELLAERTGQDLAQAECDASMLADHVAVLKELGMGFVKQQPPFSEVFIRQLHEKLLASQDDYEVLGKDRRPLRLPLAKGSYKTLPNSPSGADGVIKHHYCLPTQTSAEMHNLCKFYRESARLKETSASVRAAWLHHRFVCIHPFADGNGRVARTLASMVFVRAGLLPLLIHRDEHRTAYLKALRRADDGDLDPLVRLFVSRQVEGIGELFAMMPSTEASHALATAAERLHGSRAALRRQRAQRLYQYAVAMGASDKLESLRSELISALASVAPHSQAYRVTVAEAVQRDDEQAHRFDAIVEKVARSYTPLTLDISCYWCFAIRTREVFEVVVHLHERSAAEGGGFALSAFALLADAGQEMEEPTALRIGRPFFAAVADAADKQVLSAARQWGADVVVAAISLWSGMQ